MASHLSADVRGQPRIEPAPFVRIPPFPGSKVADFTCSAERADGENCPVDALVDRIRTLRVGGTYWAAQPPLPPNHLLLRASAPAELCERVAPGRPVVRWNAGDAPRSAVTVSGDCDPWHMLAGAAALIAAPGDEVSIIAALLGVPTYTHDAGTGDMELLEAGAPGLLAKVLSGRSYLNPFTCEPMSAAEAVELCGFWRRLIDSNRGIAGGIGFAFWKQDNVAPLLWSGGAPFRFFRSVPARPVPGPLAIWRARTSAEALAAIDRSGVPLVEVEDGFLRSRGLGADCVPPLSITVDRLGAYFDPAQPSELELLIQDGSFDEQLVARARRLRQAIVAAGLGKYDRSDIHLERSGDERRHILVPGQVEGDRSVETGGCGIDTNLDLLARVREQAPDAYILYKPHPDVVAGHRGGAIREQVCLRYADRIVTDLPMASLIAMVDEVHVNTSLAGFEALMREKAVTTYGVPFYAGWGLTEDLGPVPGRRSARRSIDELVAAALLLYPRYLDPVTGLPSPAEVVVGRLGAERSTNTGLVVTMRRMQGKIMRRFRSLAS